MRRTRSDRVRAWRRVLAGLAAVSLWISVCGAFPMALAAEPQGHPEVYVVNLTGSINPGSALTLERALRLAADARADLLVVRLDTPGGLVSSLRAMVQGIMASPVPVAVYVAPSGARAASAGALLTMAAQIAAMAPGTNIGAAHPVSIGGGDSTMNTKIENDLAAMARSIAQDRGRNATWAERAVLKSASATAQEALGLKVIDLIAPNLETLLTDINGRTVQMAGGPVTLHLSNPRVVTVSKSLRERLLEAIADPNIAFILMMIGIVGLYFEIATPGVVLPGTVGAICLLLGLYALQTLPVNLTGLLLLLLAAILFLLELVVTSYGVLGAGGLVALVLGSLMLFDPAKTGVSIAAEVLWPTVIGVGVFLAAIAGLATKAALSKAKSGGEGLVGETGATRTAVGPKGGKVFVHGELWTAISDEDIPENSDVEVVRLEGLKLRVRKIEDRRVKR